MDLGPDYITIQNLSAVILNFIEMKTFSPE